MPNQKISPKMRATLKQLKSTQLGQTTSFGYVPGQQGGVYDWIYLNAATVKALITRGLLEESGSIPWQVVVNRSGTEIGDRATLYRISALGEQVLQPDDPKIYPTWAEAQTAMDRGETVRVEQEPFTVDPSLVQLAQDLQDKQRLKEWEQCQNH